MKRKPVSPEHAERIQRAIQAMTDARDERNAAILEALRAGASMREIARVAGMSKSQIQNIAKVIGWPDRIE